MEKKELTKELKEQIFRVRKIREDLGYSQEQFAQILGISISAYKKIEACERQISLANLKKLYEELNVSTDYILFGDKERIDDIWTGILNCSEADKLILLLRLLHYFVTVKSEVFPIKGEQLNNIEDVVHFIDSMQSVEKNDAT